MIFLILCWHIASAQTADVDADAYVDADINAIVKKYADELIVTPPPIEAAPSPSTQSEKEWKIKVDDGQTPTGYIEQYDCNELTQFCSDTDCSLFANSMRYLPTESIYGLDKETFKEGLALFNNEHNDAKLLCVDANMFRAVRTMYGLVDINGAKQFVSMEFEHSYWTVKPIKESTYKSPQRPCKQAREVCAGNEGLEHCMQNGRFPFVKVDEQKHAFKQLRKCDDGGKRDGIQCTEIVCAESTYPMKKAFHGEPIQAIIKCNDGNEYSHQIFYQQKQNRYCMSHCSKQTIKENDDDSCKTLQGELQRQGVTNVDIVQKIMDENYALSVSGIVFWNDAVHRINKFQKNNKQNYKKMNDWKLFDYDISFHSFPKNIQSQLNKLRKCTTGCQKYKLIPWDSLQLMQNLNWIRSGNEKMSRTKVDNVTSKQTETSKPASIKQESDNSESKVGVKQVIKEGENDGSQHLYVTIFSYLIPLILILAAYYIVLR